MFKFFALLCLEFNLVILCHDQTLVSACLEQISDHYVHVVVWNGHLSFFNQDIAISLQLETHY